MGLRRDTIEDAIRTIQDRLDEAAVGKPSELSAEEQQRLVAELKLLLAKRRKSPKATRRGEGWRT